MEMWKWKVIFWHALAPKRTREEDDGTTRTTRVSCGGGGVEVIQAWDNGSKLSAIVESEPVAAVCEEHGSVWVVSLEDVHYIYVQVEKNKPLPKSNMFFEH